MRQDPNNFQRGERPNQPAPRPRWQNGGYFPYNKQAPRPGVNPGEFRTPPGLARAPQQAPPRMPEPAPYTHAPPVQPPAHPASPQREYYGSPRQEYYAPAPPSAPTTQLAPSRAEYYPEPYQQEQYAPLEYYGESNQEYYTPVRERIAPTREPIVSDPPKRRGGVLRVILLVLLCVVVAGGTGAFMAQMILRDWEAMLPTEMPGIQAPIETPEPLPTSTPLPEGVLSATEISELGRQQVVSIRAEVAGRVASGTGFIISDDGYILTNYHVVEGASRITVSMDNGASHEAVLLGGEFVTSDVAVLKIDAEGLSPAEIGRSATLQVGTPIYVVGNPLELNHSLTSGLVSALDREVSIDHGQVISMFQIDASVNPGNSGGPVYNQFGEIVGIVTAKSNLDGVEGIGFALPIDDAMRYAMEIIARGPAPSPPAQAQGNQPWLGISPIPITQEDAEEFQMMPGVFVQNVYEGSAAEQAGMQEGDVILYLDGVQVPTVDALREIISRHSVGDTVMVTIWRNGEILELPLTLTARPAD